MIKNCGNILLVFTGGTINMKLNENFETMIDDNFADELMQIVEGEFQTVTFSPIMFGGFPSPHITPQMMLQLAKNIENKHNEHNYDGIIVIHGTDTLEETAFFLDTYFKIDAPIVVCGAMRNGSEIGYDGWSNLISAIKTVLSTESEGRGVLVVMNEQINAANEVTKTHTMALDTFRSLEFGPVGIIESDSILYYRKPFRATLHFAPTKINKNVALIKATTGMDSELLDFYIQKNIDGIVIEAFGRGNIPPLMVPGVKKAIEKNIPVWITSRCLMGRVAPRYSYEGGGMHLTKLGVKFIPSLSPAKVRLLLMMKLSCEK